jgi:2-oxoglutarate ferredoxin oxidoreductase subunit beta
MRLVHGEPIRFGKDLEKGVIRTSDGHIKVVNVAEVGEDAIIRHDAHAKDPGLAFALSRLSNPRTLENTPIGVFRDIHRPSYDRLVREQIEGVIEAKGPGDLQSLLNGGDTWTVG